MRRLGLFQLESIHESTKHMKRWTIRLSLAGGSVLMVFLVCEIMIRTRTTYVEARKGPLFGNHSPARLIRHTGRGKRLIPGSDIIVRNHHTSKQDVNMRINSIGLRDDELRVPKGEDELRILVLGDSITWGDYLEAEQVFLEQAEMLLDAAIPERTVELINAGIADIGIKEEIDILEDIGFSTEPDVVLLAFYLNDSRPPWGFTGEMGRPNWLRQKSVFAEELWRMLKMKEWIKKTGHHRFAWVDARLELDWAHDPAALRELAHLARYDWGAAWSKDSWDVIVAELKTLAALASRHDFEVAVVQFPVVFQVESEGFVDDEPQRTMNAILEEFGFPCLDLLPMLREHRSEQLFFDQCHPRVATNAMIGEALAEFLMVEVLEGY